MEREVHRARSGFRSIKYKFTRLSVHLGLSGLKSILMKDCLFCLGGSFLSVQLEISLAHRVSTCLVGDLSGCNPSGRGSVVVSSQGSS